MFRICGRLPTAESSSLYSFVFVFGPSHSRSQAERFLWNRFACSDTKKICVCLLLILFYVSTQCFHACWHVHLIHIFHAHSAWLKTSRILRRKEVLSLSLTAGVVYNPGLPQRGQLPHPPCVPLNHCLHSTSLCKLPPLRSTKPLSPFWFFI